jgi:hypothetical protein
MLVSFNYQRQHVLQVPFLLEKAFRSLSGIEVVDNSEEADLVVNSMPWNGVKRGKKATVYWELDIAEKAFPGEYGQFDFVYIPSNMRKELWTDNCRFLPMAVDFDYYFPMDVKPEYDVVYMGRMDRNYRQEYIDRLSKKFKVLNTSAERGVSTTKILSTGKCSFQISEFSNLEQRNFEYSAVVPMVLERVADIDVFEEDKHYRGFERGNYEEFEKQIEWCIKNPKESLKMRDRMVRHLKKNHTYVNRAKQILEDLCL